MRIVNDTENFPRIIVSKDYEATVSALKEAVADIPNAGTWPMHEDAFASIREKLGMSKRVK